MMNRCLRLVTTMLILILASHFVFAQKSGYQIIVHVPSMKDTTCFLARYYGDKQYLIDTTHSDQSGTAVFSGSQKLDGGLYLFVFPDKRYFEMIVDKEQYFTMETSGADPISDMKVKNSPDNQLFYDYLRKAVAIQKNAADLQTKLASAKSKTDSAALIDQIRNAEKAIVTSRDQYIKDHPETFLAKIFITMKEPEVPKDIPTLANGRPDSTFAYRYFKEHFFDNVDFHDSRLLRTPVYGAKLNKYIHDLTVQSPDSISKEADYLVAKTVGDSEMYKYMVWWFTYTNETSRIMGMDAVFVHMVETYYLTGKTWWLDSTTMSKMIDRARKIAPNLIGNTAPELALKDSSGNWQILSKVPARYTIIVFWDPDCGHCQKEIPQLKATYDSLKSAGISVGVYAVDIEVDTAKWKKFIREHDLGSWTNVNDVDHQSNFRQLYDIYSTPVIYILDDKKVIRAKRIGEDQVSSVIYHLEKERAKS